MSIFSRIISREIPAHIVAEDASHLAFLDINPVQKGHVLVIPKKETDYLFDISDEELSELFIFAKKVAAALKKSVPCKKVGVTVIGLEVPHAHIHLIPMNEVGDANFSGPRVSVSQEELKEIAAAVAGNF